MSWVWPCKHLHRRGVVHVPTTRPRAASVKELVAAFRIETRQETIDPLRAGHETGRRP